MGRKRVEVGDTHVSPTGLVWECIVAKPDRKGHYVWSVSHPDRRGFTYIASDMGGFA